MCILWIKSWNGTGNYTIPEVCVYFDHKLLRGNRTVKVLFLFRHWSISFTKQIFLAWQKKTFKFLPFLYMAIHRPPVPADEETLTHRSSCPTRFVLGPLFWRSQWQTNIVEQCARHWQVVLCVPGQCWRPTRLWQSEPFAVSKGTTTSQSPMKPFDFKYQVIALRLLMLSWFELTWR